MSLKALYGVAGLTASQLSEYVVSVTNGCFVVNKNKVEKIGDARGLTCVIFIGVSQFLKHSSRVKKDHMALVVDAPERLSTIRGLLSLGYTSLRSGHYAYTPLGRKEVLDCVVDAGTSDTEVHWTHVSVDPLKVIVQNDETDGVMNKMRTLLYAIPHKELRASVEGVVYQYLTGKQGLAGVSQRLAKCLGPATREKIRSLLVSDQGKLLRQAYTRYKVRPSSVEAICKTHKVSMFTLRYLEAKTRSKEQR